MRHRYTPFHADEGSIGTAKKRLRVAVLSYSVQDSRTQGEEKSQPPASHLNTLRGDLSSGDTWRYVPVERVRFRDGAVEPTGCPGADHFKQEHDAVPRLLGDGQVDVLS